MTPLFYILCISFITFMYLARLINLSYQREQVWLNVYSLITPWEFLLAVKGEIHSRNAMLDDVISLLKTTRRNLSLERSCMHEPQKSCLLKSPGSTLLGAVLENSYFICGTPLIFFSQLFTPSFCFGVILNFFIIFVLMPSKKSLSFSSLLSATSIQNK